MTGTPRLLKLAAQRFDYPAVEVGKTPDGMVTVWVDTSLPPAAKTLAASLLSNAPQLVAECVAWYGIPMQPVNLIVAPLSGSNDGTGGAYHMGCDFETGGDLYVDYTAGNLAMDTGLFIAELVECFMGAAGKGWNCGGSGGEALSRLQAELVSGGPSGALGAFASAPSWDQAGRPNWIDQDQGTDQDYPSIGCGMVYMSWMMSQGFSAAAITQVGEPAGTLESNYVALTGRSGAYVAMMGSISGDGPIQITNDDPFGGIAANPTGTPQPQPVPSPPTPPSPPIPPLPPVPPAPPAPPTGTPITKAMLQKAIATLPD